jgi:hypothetical protein
LETTEITIQIGGYLRIAADQRWLQAVIRFRARHRALPILFLGPRLHGGHE